jgi:hypothetical protein
MRVARLKRSRSAGVMNRVNARDPPSEPLLTEVPLKTREFAPKSLKTLQF